MLNQKCFCLPLWVWVLALGVIVYYVCYKEPENKQKAVEEKEEKKEKFSNDTNSKLKIFNFNTEWCGWSQRFQPEWDNFTETVKSNPELNSRVEVFDVKCDKPANKKMCEAYNVPGYPYVIVEKNGIRSPYKGERTAQALLSFVSA